MEHSLWLPVDYKGRELEFPFSVAAQGHVYKFIVQVEDAEVVFERDEGGELRAIIQTPETFTGKLPDTELLQAIAETIEVLQA